jgi:predicted tellurium resistance membrane protein TerC
MAELFTVNALAALATLAILEIVLGIDNIVFLAILTGKLPTDQQPRARTLGLGLAALGRVALLLAISWVITLDKTVLFEVPFAIPGSPAAPVTPHSAEGLIEEVIEHRTPVTAKDLVLILGGLFLLAKSTWEIGHQLEAHEAGHQRTYSSLPVVLAQIVAIDLVFSLDSVLTAIGMVQPDEYTTHWVPLTIMIAAILLAIAVMMLFSGPISRFVNRHPSVKMLALAFLILIGVVLVAEGLHTHIPRGYIYFAMAFSLGVEMLNLRAASRAETKQRELPDI